MFSASLKVKDRFLCEDEETGNAFETKLAVKWLDLKRHFERHHVGIFKRVVETDEVETSQMTASNAVCKKETLSKFSLVKKLLCRRQTV